MRFSRLKKQIEESGRPPAAQQSTSKPNSGKGARSQAQGKTAANGKGKASKSIPAWSACAAAVSQSPAFRATIPDCSAFPAFPSQSERFHRPSLPTFIDLTVEPDDNVCACPGDFSDEDVPLIKRRRTLQSASLMGRHSSNSNHSPRTALPSGSGLGSLDLSGRLYSEACTTAMKDPNVSTDREFTRHPLSQGPAGPSTASDLGQPQIIDLTTDDEPFAMEPMPNSEPAKENATGQVDAGRDSHIHQASLPQPCLADADVALFGDGPCESPFPDPSSNLQQRPSSQQQQEVSVPPAASSQQPLAYEERHPYSWVFQLLDHPETTGSADAPPEIDLTSA